MFTTGKFLLQNQSWWKIFFFNTEKLWIVKKRPFVLCVLYFKKKKSKTGIVIVVKYVCLSCLSFRFLAEVGLAGQWKDVRHLWRELPPYNYI